MKLTMVNTTGKEAVVAILGQGDLFGEGWQEVGIELTFAAINNGLL